MRGTRCFGPLLVGALAVSGCMPSPTVRYVDLSPPTTSSIEVSEDLLLDVGVAVLEPNIPAGFDAQTAALITPELRRAESNYIAVFMKNLLQATGNWGAVRVIPRPTLAVDVNITGEILHSDGERQILRLKVNDARGVVWLEEEFETLASKYAYDETIPHHVDPFQSTYKQVADSMLRFRDQLSEAEVREIRTTAELRFARDFSPDAFQNHLVEDADGLYSISRLATEDDAMLSRVRKIREREYLFIDTLDEYYTSFAHDMHEPYQSWRKESYTDAIRYRLEAEKAKARLLAGTLMIASGAGMQRSNADLVEYAGYAGVIGGAGEVLGGIKARANMTMHASALRELGISAAAEITPHTIELENASLALIGTVDEQYDQLRRILRRLYYEDFDLPVPAELQDDGLNGGEQEERSTDRLFEESLRTE